MKALIRELETYLSKLPAEQSSLLKSPILDKLYSVYPFNKVEYVISHLLAEGMMTLAEYLGIRAQYIRRNKYLHLFEMAPRTFGQIWGERHLMEMIPEFDIPDVSRDPGFSGEYDLWFEGLRVEVKASRVVAKRGGDSLAEKALSFGSKARFDMNFQQLKPDCCDAFVWIAVWKDQIVYWILTSEQVRNHPHFSNQHRGGIKAGKGGVYEGQIHINDANYAEFERFRVNPHEIFERLMELAGK